MKNEMNLQVKALSKNVAFVRNVVASFCLDLNPTLDQLDEIRTAVSEAVTNSIVHAYPQNEENENAVVNIFVQTLDGALHIRITDYGKGIADLGKAMTPFYTTDDNGERAGIGFTVMKSFMDSVEISNNKDKGLTVSMRKYLVKED